LQASMQSPVELQILGEIAAGQEPLATKNSSGVWEIMTGAVLPDECDACLPVEDAKKTSDHRLLITHPIKPGQNIRQPAEDFQAGQTLLLAGARLRSEDILCLATLGLTEVEVYQRPRIGLIATGRELASLTESIEHTPRIRNSTTPFLIAAFADRGVDVLLGPTVGDNAVDFADVFRGLVAKKCDLILTTGALSVGKYDFIASALLDLGCKIYFQKVAIRPGKPLLFAQAPTETFVIGLPGNPVATVIGLRFFVDSFLDAWFGRAAAAPTLVTLAGGPLSKPIGFTSFFRASLDLRANKIRLHSQQRASHLRPLLQSDSWIELHPEQASAQSGDLVSVWPFSALQDSRREANNV
jgi:molybdopterin molybdotransferase